LQKIKLQKKKGKKRIPSSLFFFLVVADASLQI